MSAAPRYPRDLGYAGLRMTADEYLALGETDDRYELIDGVVVMSPSPFLAHQRIVREILYQLETYRRAHPDVEVVAETDVRFSGNTVYRPDIVAYRSRAAITDAERLTSAPSLVVEVLSAGTKARDLITKRDDYEKFGVDEYWVIDPNNGRLRCWRRELAQLAEFAVSGDTFASSSVPGFILDLRPVRALSGTA